MSLSEVYCSLLDVGNQTVLITTSGDIYSFRLRRFLSPCISGNGYWTVTVAGKPRYVHRLLAEAFIENPEKKSDVNHKNLVKSDNSISNLEWCTESENLKHYYIKSGAKGSGYGIHKGGGAAYDKSRSKWMSYVEYKGKRKYLGRFKTKEEAVSAYENYRVTLYVS